MTLRPKAWGSRCPICEEPYESLLADASCASIEGDGPLLFLVTYAKHFSGKLCFLEYSRDEAFPQDWDSANISV